MGGARKFMVVSDESAESVTAAHYAGLRARAVGAGLVILRCARIPGFGGWIGLDDDMRKDAEDSARVHAVQLSHKVEQKTGLVPEIVISSDEPLDAIRSLVDSDPAIKVLVLGSGSGRGGPGPLVSRLGKGRPLSSRPIAVTVVPGGLTDSQIEEMAGLD